MGRLLSCQAEKCILYMGKQHPRRGVGIYSPGIFYSLQDKEGKWAGALRPHCSSSSEETHLDAGEPCELVSISQGSIDNGKDINSDWIDEWYLSERPKVTERYYFHNVLWIEWEDGIAYRRGLGRVVDDVWKQQPVEEIMLILG
jgi:hypothetical protein